MEEAKTYLFQWKVSWAGTCAILRTAIDLFQIDGKSCISEELRAEIRNEWNDIKKDKDAHKIFWEFLRRERDNIAHEYRWQAYEAWIKPDGSFSAPRLSLLSFMEEDGSKRVLLMGAGPYAGRNSLELLHESADWVEARIYAAISRAGLRPDEDRRLSDFALRPPPGVQLMGLLSNTN